MALLAYKLKDFMKYFLVSLRKQDGISSYEYDMYRIGQSLDDSLEVLYEKKHFHYEVSRKLKLFTKVLSSLPVDTMDDTSKKVLKPLKHGFEKFVETLDKAYVNTYSCKTLIKERTEKYVKICFTVFHMLCRDLTKLRSACNESRKDRSNSSTILGKILSFFGYRVATDSDYQDGELRNCDDLTGYDITTIINKPITGANGIQHIEKCKPDDNTNINIMVLLSCLCEHLREYYKCCHFAGVPSPKPPCSLYEMLIWLCGFPYNCVCQKVKDYIKTYFAKPKGKEEEAYSSFYDTELILEAHPNDVYAACLDDYILEVCYKAENILITIVGTGDVNTFYACQYFDNSFNLYYPSDPEECLYMLLDILQRLRHVIEFLHRQCSTPASCFGWGDCQFGKGVQAAGSQYNAGSDKMLNLAADCSATSPLQLYFTDGLKGLLPHQLNSVGCNFVCSTCPASQRGMPCLTPLGFRAFSCSKRRGKDICEVLEDICGDGGVLTKLYSSLTCLLGLPPRCFPDIFAFYYQLTRMWNEMPKTPNGLDDKSMQKPICLEILNTVGCNYDTAKTFLDSCHNLYDSPSHFMHEITAGCDLGYLVGCGQQSCGNIIRPLNSSAYSVFASTYAERYLSWLVYICPQLVSFITQLKDSFGDVSCYDSLCSTCLNRDGCTKGKHGTSPCGCKSIVHCRGASSVLYRYGLTYADVTDRSQIRCHDFCTALDNILKSQTLKNFLHAIDTLLFTIRAPFFCALVALWSLSLFYVAYVFLLCLDVLGIRSHVMRAKASHTIVPYSLLAVAHVGRLSKLTYLQH